jgi:hypothetical protein
VSGHERLQQTKLKCKSIILLDMPVTAFRQQLFGAHPL